MRVTTLVPFQQEKYRARVGFRAWQNGSGTWVVSVPFCLELSPTWQVTGMPCLNPRRAVDYGVMQQFARERGVRFIFLSVDLADAVEAWVPWPPAQRRQVRRLIATIDQTLVGEKLTGAFDPDFEQASQELRDLLPALDASAALEET
jgi:hypothetical protein